MLLLTVGCDAVSVPNNLLNTDFKVSPALPSFPGLLVLIIEPEPIVLFEAFCALPIGA
jgi:hypothetical protein